MNNKKGLVTLFLWVFCFSLFLGFGGFVFFVVFCFYSLCHRVNHLEVGFKPLCDPRLANVFRIFWAQHTMTLVGMRGKWAKNRGLLLRSVGWSGGNLHRSGVLVHLPVELLVVGKADFTTVVHLLRKVLAMRGELDWVEVNEHQEERLLGLVIFTKYHVHTLDTAFAVSGLGIHAFDVGTKDLGEHLVEHLLLDKVHHARDADGR